MENRHLLKSIFRSPWKAAILGGLSGAGTMFAIIGYFNIFEPKSGHGGLGTALYFLAAIPAHILENVTGFAQTGIPESIRMKGGGGWLIIVENTVVGALVFASLSAVGVLRRRLKGGR